MGMNQIAVSQASGFIGLGDFVEQVLADPQAWKAARAEIVDAQQILDRASQISERELAVAFREEQVAAKDSELAYVAELQANCNISQGIKEKELAARDAELSKKELASQEFSARLDKREVDLKVEQESCENLRSLLDAQVATAKKEAADAEAARVKYEKALSGLEDLIKKQTLKV